MPPKTVAEQIYALSGIIRRMEQDQRDLKREIARKQARYELQDAELESYRTTLSSLRSEL